jgi:COMPASS component SPP1
MPDLDVDLVDQFFCPSCIESVFLVFHPVLAVINRDFSSEHPQSSLRTTYKQRCLWGMRHPNPDSPKACHKAARGAFSKYCSDECGVKYMQTRVENWAKKGGKTDKLWESVKDAERREGIVVCAMDKMDTESDVDGLPVKPKIVRPSKTKIERETERLNNILSSIVKMREDIQRGMEIIVCRERLLQLASERAEQVGQCGWDQRLCCDDEELADIGAGMLESYEVDGVKEENGDNDMDVDGHDEQWWCPGKKVCDRHSGYAACHFPQSDAEFITRWQTIRYKDVCKEKEMREEALAKLTLRERDLRKRIEDIRDPHASDTKSKPDNDCNAPLKSSTTKLVNGFAKTKVTATEKKGKKRKAPSF